MTSTGPIAMSTPDSIQHVLALQGELTIASIAERMGELRDVLDGRDLMLDVSAVTHVDGAGLQLLMFAAREAAARGGSVVLRAPDRAMRSALDMARLDERLAVVAAEVAA
jgi:anti-anti-sigma factor